MIRRSSSHGRRVRSNQPPTERTNYFSQAKLKIGDYLEGEEALLEPEPWEQYNVKDSPYSKHLDSYTRAIMKIRGGMQITLDNVILNIHGEVPAVGILAAPAAPVLVAPPAAPAAPPVMMGAPGADEEEESGDE